MILVLTKKETQSFHLETHGQAKREQLSKREKKERNSKLLLGKTQRQSKFEQLTKREKTKKESQGLTFPSSFRPSRDIRTLDSKEREMEIASVVKSNVASSSVLLATKRQRAIVSCERNRMKHVGICKQIFKNLRTELFHFFKRLLRIIQQLTL